MKLQLYPSANDLDNLQVFLVAALSGVEVERGVSDATCPVLPFIEDAASKKTVFGVNAIVRYMLNGGKNKMSLTPADEDLLDIDEFHIKSIVNKLLKSKVPVDKYFAEELVGSKPADKKTAALLEEALDLYAPRIAAGLSAGSPAATAAAPTLLACIRLLPPALAAAGGKYAALAAQVGVVKASPEYTAALAKVRSLAPGSGAASAASKGVAVAAPAKAIPAVDVDIQRDGLISSLKTLFTNAIHLVIPGAAAAGFDTDVKINRCNNVAHGDYQCNNAMALAKALKVASQAEAGSSSGGMGGYKGGTAPRDVAAAIVAHLAPNTLIRSAAAQPNGFINIFIADEAVVKSVVGSLVGGIQPPNLPKKKILVDFSSPNIAKEMHVGHLRSTIIGDTLCKVFEFCGHDVMRVNHVGDWGTQFGMLISHLMDEYPDILTNPPNISDLTQIYKAAKRRFDAEPEFKERSRLNVVKLQAGDPNCHTVWNLLCSISRAEFQVLYDALGVSLTEVGESFYNTMIPGAIEKLAEQGNQLPVLSYLALSSCIYIAYVTNYLSNYQPNYLPTYHLLPTPSIGLVQDDQGMKIVMLPGWDIPLIVRKSDGGYGYDSTDMAAVLYRLQKLDR
jgi:hypothetical protein